MRYAWTYFQPTMTLDEAKQRRRELVRQHHPDAGGDTATMAAINAEFDALVDVIERAAQPQIRVAAPATMDPAAWWATVCQAARQAPPRPQPQAAPQPQPQPKAPRQPRQPKQQASGQSGAWQVVWFQGDVTVELLRGATTYARVLQGGAVVREWSGAPQSWRKLERAAVDFASKL